MLSRDKITEIFCIADDFCKEFDSNMKEMALKADGKKHRNSSHGRVSPCYFPVFDFVWSDMHFIY